MEDGLTVQEIIDSGDVGLCEAEAFNWGWAPLEEVPVVDLDEDDEEILDAGKAPPLFVLQLTHILLCWICVTDSAFGTTDVMAIMWREPFHMRRVASLPIMVDHVGEKKMCDPFTRLFHPQPDMISSLHSHSLVSLMTSLNLSEHSI